MCESFIFSMNRCKLTILLSLLLLGSLNVSADWKKVNANTFAWLRSVYFLNPETGWIVGSQGTFLSTTDGGKSWKSSKSVCTDTILDVYFADEKRGWVLCEYDVFGRGAASPSYIQETKDGGYTWERVRLEGEGNDRLLRLFFSNDGYGRVVGEAGTFFAMQDDRKTWKRSNPPVRFLLIDGNFFSRNNGVVVGGGGTSLFTEDGGLSWYPASFVGTSKTKLNSVHFINAATGWTVGAEGRIFTSVNGGRLWRSQVSNSKRDLLDVSFADTAEGWAVGEGGEILHTKTAGNIWTPVEGPSKLRLERVVFAGKNVWAVGFGGTILRYDKSLTTPKTTQPAPVLQKRNYAAAN